MNLEFIKQLGQSTSDPTQLAALSASPIDPWALSKKMDQSVLDVIMTQNQQQPSLGQAIPGAQQEGAPPPQAPFGSVPPSAPTGGAPQPQMPPAPPLGAMMPPIEIQPGPPTDAQQQAHRASGWQLFSKKLQTDPAWQMALLSFGTNLMQPVQPGQSKAGHFGQALTQGANTLSATQQGIRKAGLEERRVAADERRVAADETRVRHEGRRVDVVEKTADEQIKESQQKRAHNEKLYPKTIEKLDADIKKLVAAGKVDEAQAEFLSERARLYPQEVQADLRRASAAERSADKPGQTTEMFAMTAQAMVDSGEVKTLPEALSKLGAAHFGKAGGKASSTVQNRNQMREELKKAHPKEASESDEAFEQRISKALLEFEKTSKKKEFFDAKVDFLKNSIDKGQDQKVFDDLWKSSGREFPEGYKPTRTSVTRAEIKATAQANSMSEKDVERLIKESHPGIRILK